MRQQGWTAHAFQEEVWAACAEGRSGLLHATTGSGKTYAVWLGVLQRAQALASMGRGEGKVADAGPSAGPRVVWITPMRALAADTVLALQRPLEGQGAFPNWRVEARTGDTASSVRARQ
jgi:ATP-dependent Lhr-like helicase